MRFEISDQISLNEFFTIFNISFKVIYDKKNSQKCSDINSPCPGPIVVFNIPLKGISLGKETRETPEMPSRCPETRFLEMYSTL
jgi:hypothetical protein